MWPPNPVQKLFSRRRHDDCGVIPNAAEESIRKVIASEAKPRAAILNVFILLGLAHCSVLNLLDTDFCSMRNTPQP